MLVAVRAPEGKAGLLTVALTTDLAAEAFLHWGVKREGAGDWLTPPEAIWPPGSAPVEGNAAALDSPFLPCDEPDALGIKVRTGGCRDPDLCAPLCPVALHPLCRAGPMHPLPCVRPKKRHLHHCLCGRHEVARKPYTETSAVCHQNIILLRHATGGR